MKTILTIGGIGLIAYAIYEWLVSSQAPASAATSAAGSTDTGTTFTQPAGNPPPAATPQPQPLSVITAAVLNSAAAGDPAVVNGMATSYVWNYYYSNLSGVHQTFAPPNPLNAISAATYLALRKSAGLSGFRGNNFNPYTMRYPLIHNASRMVQ